MAILNMDKFPSSVCRLCLQSQENEISYAVKSFKNEDGNYLKDEFNGAFVPIPEDVVPHLPTNICISCYETFDSFYKYREKINLILHFQMYYVEAKSGRPKALEELLRTRNEKVCKTLKELKICQVDFIDVDRLLEELLEDNFTIEQIDVKTESDYSNDADYKITEKSKFKNKEKIKNDILLKCQQCRFKTFFVDNYEIHVNRHKIRDSNKIFQCKFPDCLAILSTKVELNKHKQESHSKFICDICGLALKHKYTLEIHLRRHKGDTKYNCDYCNSSYFTSNELKLHTSVVHVKSGNFKCHLCGLSFKNKKSLTLHEKSHSDQRTFICDMCPLAFKTSAHLRRHFNGVHRAIKYNCELCSISYGRKDKLRMHMEVAHGIQTYFNCDICLKSFQSHQKLEEHMILHKNPKDLECGRCLTAYLTQEEFNNHLCITYRDNYNCCDRDFKYHLYFNKHMFLVHGVKVNVRVKPVDNVLTGCARAKRKIIERCSKCDKVFPSRRLKKEHVQICETISHQ